jgi:hypothetical protein
VVPPLPSLREQIYATVRVDDLGRRWEVDHLDEDRLCSDLWSIDPAYSCDLDSIPAESPAVEPVYGDYTPATWFDTKVCYAGSDPNETCADPSPECTRQYYWDDDERNTYSDWDNLTARQKKLVSLHLKDTAGVDFICSGIVYSVNKVLTAAHCVVEHPNLPLDPMDLKVCTYGNGYGNRAGSTCVDVVSFEPHHNFDTWDLPGTMAHDFAVLTVSTDLEQLVGNMFLTAKSAAQVNAQGSSNIHSGGFSAFTMDGQYGNSAQCQDHLTLQGTNNSFNGLKVVHMVDQIQIVQNNVIESQHDISSGESGGAFWWCSDGACDDEDSNNPGRILGIVGGFASTMQGNKYTAAPFVPSRAAWVQAQ